MADQVELRKKLSAEHLEAMEENSEEFAEKNGGRVEIPKLKLSTVQLRLVGDSPLISHRFDEKVIRQIVDKSTQTGTSATPRPPKDPWAEFLRSMYWISPQPKDLSKITLDDVQNYKFGFPSRGFKNCAVTACTSLGRKVPKTLARQAFHVLGDIVEVNHGRVEMREDPVRIAMGGTDIRYRAQFVDWTCMIRISFNQGVVSVEQLGSIFNLAGFAVGLGEWRPERDGNFGMFHVE